MLSICSLMISTFSFANICSTFDTSSTQRPFITLKVQGVTSTWLYDTGAAANCMSLTEFRKIPPEQRPPKLPTLYNLSTASADSLKIVGVYNMCLQVNNRSVTSPVFVCSNLNQKAILGMDAIRKFGLIYSPLKNSFSFESIPVCETTLFPTTLASLSLVKSVKIPALTSVSVPVSVISDNAYCPPPGVTGLAHIGSPAFPLLNGGPGLVQTNRFGETTVRLNNCSPAEVEIPKHTKVGFLESVNPHTVREVNKDLFVAAIDSIQPPPPLPILAHDKQRFLKVLNLSVPEQEKDAYLELLLNNHDVFSKDPNDLGCATNHEHTIHLRNTLPTYTKQFPIPESYRDQLTSQVKEWLKMGIVQPTNSPYNSPIFVVPKKDGTPRYVLDFRKLNANSQTDKYSMKTVEECIGDIGRSGSTIFSTLDLSSGFWQLPLEKNSQKCTAFTVHNLGQFEWTRTSQGLHSAPSQYQRLMELTTKGLHNIIVYIDDLLVHTSDHMSHRKSLQLLFDRLRKANLKLNLKKCYFGSTNVTYLGFRLTPQGILPGSDKLAAVKNARPPTNVHQIRQFLGLANFFRTHIRNFSVISSPLNVLTRKDTRWRGGPLPPPALKAFNELRSALCSEPVVNYPRKDRPYALIVDAATGNDKNEGGCGAILCQADEKGDLHVISYASRSLSKHEKNYTPFLAELTACCWGIEHFSVYLRGRKFTLYTDHKPLEKLSVVHTKTFNRLQQIMNEHDFIICHKKGDEMAADFLSRNVVSNLNITAINIFDKDLLSLQNEDQFIKSVSNFIKLGQLPLDPLKAAYVTKIAPTCFFENDILWRRLNRHDMPQRNVLLLPLSLTDEIIHDTHTSLLSGHEGISRTKERLLQNYFWPNMENKISQHVTACTRCQVRRTSDRPRPPLLTSMPQCTSLNQRVAIDLMGPLRTSTHGKNYVLCMTDAFTKYAEIVAIPDKSAPVVARVLFEKWICRFGCPVEFTSDNGKEFCNQLTDELFKLLQIKHATTTPYHPQCNAQAEVQNKIIAKYLSSFVDSTTLDWPLYMAPMAFAYNTALHRSIKATPFFLTYGIEPRLPAFPTPDVRRYYGQSDVAEWFATLQHCRQLATHHNINASDEMQAQFNKKASPYNYTLNQLVYLDVQNFLGKNRKIAPRWMGPYPITKLFDAGVVQLQLNNRQLRVNVSRIKPYVSPIPIPNNDPIIAPTWDDPVSAQPPVTTPPTLLPQPQPHYVPPPPIMGEPMLPRYAPPPPPPQAPPPLPAPPAPPLLRAPPPPPPILAPHHMPAAPRPVIYVPQLLAAPPAAAPPPAPVPIPPLRRVTRALARTHGTVLHPPLAAIHKSSPFYWHQAVSIGPPYLTDKYGLPVIRPGHKVPQWVLQRRHQLRRLPPSQLNRHLTGDPAFRYDPVPYDDSSFLWRPAVAPPQEANEPDRPPTPPVNDLQIFDDDSPPPSPPCSPPPPPSPPMPPAPRRPRRPPTEDPFSNAANAQRPPDSALPSGRWMRSSHQKPVTGLPGRTPAPAESSRSSADQHGSRSSYAPQSSSSTSRPTRSLSQQLGSLMDSVFPPTMASPPPRLPTLAETIDNFFPPFSLDETPSSSHGPASLVDGRWHDSGQQQPRRGQQQPPKRGRPSRQPK